jgi:hypothetical protein
MGALPWMTPTPYTELSAEQWAHRTININGTAYQSCNSHRNLEARPRLSLNRGSCGNAVFPSASSIARRKAGDAHGFRPEQTCSKTFDRSICRVQASEYLDRIEWEDWDIKPRGKKREANVMQLRRDTLPNCIMQLNDKLHTRARSPCRCKYGTLSRHVLATTLSARICRSPRSTFVCSRKPFLRLGVVSAILVRTKNVDAVVRGDV